MTTRKARLAFCGVAAFACLLAAPRALSAETDQFLVWDIQLADSAPALNAYLNEEAQRFLDGESESHGARRPADLVAQDLYLYLFRSLLDSRLRHYLMTSPGIDRYPPASVSYPEHLEMSIYSAKSFPFILPMARTIRIGDVYLGIDKLSHFFGFGRRYYKRFLRLREEGLPEQDALEKTIEWGMWCERYLVGNLTDGVYSYADLEANFQGMLMARSLCEGPSPLLRRQGLRWTLAHPLDIRPYITPGFDESYNCSRFMGTRRRHVLQVLEAEVCPKRSLPSVLARFERYKQWTPSLSQQYIERKTSERGWTPGAGLAFELWCASCQN